ncbi:hypothetical protein B0T11DRAFT_116958 [Plectosphaerella cucumerina]|uniref:Uncharacterized protein n=1 Tax=Plectosphaerella cucumerina TaxID=40658 RepID=A0A8K0T9D0_9PEZI|nr:hypothetical protein B0T11DRAFT_116958 [Plectosphaerella cucumerina]
MIQLRAPEHLGSSNIAESPPSQTPTGHGCDLKMIQYRHPCTLCGEGITWPNTEPLWTSQFVAIYAVGFDLNARVFLSGLGRRDQWWDFFPVTEPLELPDNEFNGNWFKIHLLPQYFEDRHFDSESPYACGFPFHVSCWEHLSRVFPVRKKASKSASRFEDDSTSIGLDTSIAVQPLPRLPHFKGSGCLGTQLPTRLPISTEAATTTTGSTCSW